MKAECKAQRELIEALMKRKKPRLDQDQPFFMPPSAEDVFPFASLSREENLCFITFTDIRDHSKSIKFRVEEKDTLSLKDLYEFLKQTESVIERKVFANRVYATFRVFVTLNGSRMVLELAIRGGKLYAVNQTNQRCWAITHTWRFRFTWKRLLDMYRHKHPRHLRKTCEEAEDDA